VKLENKNIFNLSPNVETRKQKEAKERKGKERKLDLQFFHTKN
jgi:hypothetical protein